MTNKFAATLGLLIVGAIVADLVANDGIALMFLVRKFADMVEWMAFWR